MANEGRFLNKKLIRADGLIDDLGNVVINEGGAWNLVGGANLGDGAVKIAKILSTTLTVSLSVLNPVGSGPGGVLGEYALAGVVPGDVVLAQPVASVPLSFSMWSACCYSEG